MLAQEEATRSITGDESQKENTYRSSISLGFSLQLCTREGLSVKGDLSMQKTATGIPPRASRQADVTQEYDDDSVGGMPRSALVWRASNTPNAPRATATHDTVTQKLTTTNRVSGSTRLGLIVLLILCIAFLFNGLVMPAIIDFQNQLRYGDARITTYYIDARHFIAQDDHSKVRIVIATDDGAHDQILTTVVSGAPNHAIVVLVPNGKNIDVAINGVSAFRLEPDGHGGYKWGAN